MSSDLEEPSERFVADLESLIKEKLGKDVAVYTCWIPPKARMPCVRVIEVMAGLFREVGIGQVVSANVIGVHVAVRAQIDIWARSVNAAREKANKVFYVL